MIDTWQERLLVEYDELCDNLTKLSQFVNTAAFDNLHIDDRTLMIRQEALMKQLTDVLKQRLDRATA